MSSNRPLRVAVDQRLASYRGGGIARYAAELTAALREFTDIEPLPVLSARERMGSDRSIRVRTPPHHRFEEWALGVELLLRGRSASVYHATDFIAPRLAGIPVVATVHDLAFLRWPEDLAPEALAYYSRIHRSKRWTQHWIAPSRWSAKELSDLLGISADDITVIPHGPPSFVRVATPLPRERRGRYLLAVGTVEPRKRYDLLLDAFENMTADVELKIAGASGWRSGETERRLREMAGVDWIERADDQQLATLYREAIAVAIPSRAEGFSLTALEAMAAGTPVVSSGRGALPEVTGECALVPESDDAGAWSRALQQVVEDDRHWQRLSEGGYARAHEFSWRRAAEQTAAVYRRVAG